MWDKFKELPTSQKVMLVVVVIAILGVLVGG